MANRIVVQPIYGWGWSGVPGAPVEPAPFHMIIDQRVPASGPAKSLLGQVSEPSHPLHSRFAYLTGRHLAFDGHYDARFFADRPLFIGANLEWREAFNRLVIGAGFVIVESE